MSNGNMKRREVNKPVVWAILLAAGFAVSCTSNDRDRTAEGAPTTEGAATSGAGAKHNLGDDGLALQGYDPVAYFDEGSGEPTKGDPAISAEHRDATYHFANDANRQRFLDDPRRYTPAYGGWCAYAMADGEKVAINPESYLIQDGRLLVFYNRWFNDTRKPWREQPGELERKADAAWRAASGEAPPAAE